MTIDTTQEENKKPLSNFEPAAKLYEKIKRLGENYYEKYEIGLQFAISHNDYSNIMTNVNGLSGITLLNIVLNIICTIHEDMLKECGEEIVIKSLLLLFNGICEHLKIKGEFLSESAINALLIKK